MDSCINITIVYCYIRFNNRLILLYLKQLPNNLLIFFLLLL